MTEPCAKISGHGPTSAVAPAKINWVLEVVERREDGFHELETVVSKIDLVDQMAFSALTASDGIRVRCSDASVPTDEQNLVWRAATALARRSGVCRGVAIGLTKRIPVGSGLGGGSSDAATTLATLNAVWGLGWTVARLVPLAARLGSDVPLFLYGGTVIARGRGEFVEPCPLGWVGWIVVAMPGLCVPTAAVYGAVRPADLVPAPSAAGFVEMAEGAQRRTAGELMERSRNGLEAAAFRRFPELVDLHGRLERQTGRRWRLCGSGSSFFSAFDEAEEAAEAARQVNTGIGIRAEAVRVIETRAGVT